MGQIEYNGLSKLNLLARGFCLVACGKTTLMKTGMIGRVIISSVQQ
jgi:hypothetical protein